MSDLQVSLLIIGVDGQHIETDTLRRLRLPKQSVALGFLDGGRNAGGRTSTTSLSVRLVPDDDPAVVTLVVGFAVLRGIFFITRSGGAEDAGVPLQEQLARGTGAPVRYIDQAAGQLPAKQFFDEFGLAEPDHHLGVGSGSHGEQTGEMLRRLEPVASSAWGGRRGTSTTSPRATTPPALTR